MPDILSINILNGKTNKQMAHYVCGWVAFFFFFFTLT